jgi:hypothetical protein
MDGWMRCDPPVADRHARARTRTSNRVVIASSSHYVPPDASRIIFNIDLGPKVVRTTSLTALAAAMLFARAIDPVSRAAF